MPRPAPADPYLPRMTISRSSKAPGRRVTTGLATLALTATALGLAVPAQAAHPASIAVSEPGGDFVPAVRVMTPWSGTRGAISTGYATTIAAATVPNAAAVGTDVVATLTGLVAIPADRTIRGVYAWVSCPSPLGTTGQTPALGDCAVVQPHPGGPVTIDVSRLQPVGNTWRAPAANGTLFGVTNTLRITPDMVGRYLYMNYRAQTVGPAGAVLDDSVHSSAPILAMPANMTANPTAQVTTAAPTAGQAFTAQGATWGAPPAGTGTASESSAAWLCTKAAAATDTTLLWDVTNGCARVAPDSANRAISGTLPANAAGKFVVVNSTFTAKPTAASQMPGSFTWVARSAAVQVAAAPGEPAVVPTPAADAAAPAAGGGDAAPPASAPAADGGAAPAGAAAGSTSASAAAIAAGSGVNLAKAPLVGADGKGTGASSKLTMGLAASKKVNRGRYITVKTVLTPKNSTGKIRIVLARQNAKGKVIATKAIYATVNKGKASKRWQIPRKFTAANYTLVATYVPSKKGAPGVTATAPVQIG